jgi:hypothetical protein
MSESPKVMFGWCGAEVGLLGFTFTPVEQRHFAFLGKPRDEGVDLVDSGFAAAATLYVHKNPKLCHTLDGVAYTIMAGSTTLFLHDVTPWRWQKAVLDGLNPLNARLPRSNGRSQLPPGTR